MRLVDFLAQTPAFTSEELAAWAGPDGSKTGTLKSLLHHHQRNGRLLRIRRGLYATVPPGKDPDTFHPDPFLVASRLAPDSLLAYHTALELHGKAYSIHSRYPFLTNTATRPLRHRDVLYQPVLYPKALRSAHQEQFGVTKTERLGLTVSVTNLERTLVDVLDRPDLAGGWEEAWRSLESIEFFELDTVIHYALLLSNATVAAKVGFFLEQHRDSLMVEESYLRQLKKHRPKEAQYVARGHQGENRFLSRWNLVVPAALANRSWEEVP